VAFSTVHGDEDEGEAIAAGFGWWFEQCLPDRVDRRIAYDPDAVGPHTLAQQGVTR
jgi:hypothetical protein